MKLSTKILRAALVALSVAAITQLPAAAQASAPSDPQIVGIVLTANQIDIDHAKLALQHSKNKQVRDFAQQMVDDHTSLQNSVKDLGSKLQVTPADSDTQKSLQSQADQETA